MKLSPDTEYVCLSVRCIIDNRAHCDLLIDGLRVVTRPVLLVNTAVHWGDGNGLFNAIARLCESACD